MAVPTTTFRSNVGLPRGYTVDPVTGELVRSASQNVPMATSSPTFAPTTNYETLSQRPDWETGETAPGVPTHQAGTSGQYYTDQYGDVWGLVGDRWVKQTKLPNGATTYTNGSPGEVSKRLQDMPSNEMPGFSEYDERGLAAQVKRPVRMPGQPGYQGTNIMGGAPNGSAIMQQQAAQSQNELDNFNGQNRNWQDLLYSGVNGVTQAQQDQLQRQIGHDNDAIRSMNDLFATQQNNAARANQQSANLFADYRNQQSGLNSQDQAALGRFNTDLDSVQSRISGMNYNPVAFDAEGLGAQRNALNWASGVAGGSLNYNAAQSGLTQAQLYQAPAAAQAQLTKALAEQYSSSSADINRQWQAMDDLYGVSQGSLDYAAAQWQTPDAVRQRQLDGLQAIDDDMRDGHIDQYNALQDIEQELRSGGNGQRAAIAALQREIDAEGGTATAAQRDAMARLRNEIDNGGQDFREGIAKYKELTTPQATAQERYLAEIARRSFEAQDRGNREAQMQDLAFRGLRSGGAEVAAMDSQRQQLGQDRTQAELGLQANAVGRSMQALEGYTSASGQLRAQQLQGEGMYNEAAANARAQQQQALAMVSEAENALRAAQQQGLAMSAAQTNAIRASHQNAVAMYNDAAARLREAEDSVGMFNTNAKNQAFANNQSTRLTGHLSSAQQANTIRGQNDAVGMFNTGQVNQVGMFNAGQANNMSMFNAGERNNVNMFNTGQANQNSQFNAGQANQVGMFNAGQTNQARANNQSAMLAGGIQQGNMANNIRSANDAINMFNSNQSMVQQRWQADSLAGLAGQRLTGNNATTGQISGRNSDMFGAGMGVNDSQYARDRDTVGMGISNTGAQHTMRTNTNNFAGGIPQTTFGNLQSAYGSFLAGSGQSSSMSTQNRLQQQQMTGLGILAQNNPKYRMA